MNTLKLILPVILLLSSTAANSAVVTFTDRTLFQAAAGITITEDFNSAPTGLFNDAGLDLGDFTLTDTDPLSGRIADDNFLLRSEQSNYVAASRNSSSSLTFNFDIALTAFGFNQYGFLEGTAFFGQESGIILDGTMLPGLFFIEQPFGTSATFFGFTSDTPFSSIQFIRGNGFITGLGNEYAIDDVEYAVSAVPLPAAAWLFGSVILGMFGFFRKQKSIV